MCGMKSMSVYSTTDRDKHRFWQGDVKLSHRKKRFPVSSFLDNVTWHWQDCVSLDDSSVSAAGWGQIIRGADVTKNNQKKWRRWKCTWTEKWINSSSHFFNSYAFPSHLFLLVTFFCDFHMKNNPQNTTVNKCKITSRLLTSTWTTLLC